MKHLPQSRRFLSTVTATLLLSLTPSLLPLELGSRQRSWAQSMPQKGELIALADTTVTGELTPESESLDDGTYYNVHTFEGTEGEADRLLQEGFQLFQQGTTESLQQSIATWKQALYLYQHSGNQAREALTLNNIGQVYSDLGEKQKALEYLNQALPLTRAVGDRVGEATTLFNIGLVYDDLGEKQRALEFYNQALPLRRAVGDRGGEAITLTGIGLVYFSLGEKQRALEFYNQALPLNRAVGDRGGEATTLNNIGSVYDDLGEKQRALEFYNQALPLLRAVGYRDREAATLSNIGLVYDSLGEKQRALEYYNQALPLSQAVGDRGGEARTLTNIGNVYYSLGEKQRAWEFYNQALPLLRAVGDRGGEAITLNNIGLVYDSLGEKQRAWEFYNQALPLNRAVGDRGGEAITLNNIGLVYDSLGEKQRALEFYNQALPLNRAVGNRGGEATTLNNIGGVYSDLGEKQQALEFYNQALPLVRAVGDRRGEATTLNNIASVKRGQGNLTEALTLINASIDLIEALRNDIINPDLRQSFFATVQGYYQFKIDLLMELHRQEPSKGYDAQALQVSESSRARGLTELLTEANLDIRQGVNPTLLAEEKRLTQQLSALEKQRLDLSNKPDASTADFDKIKGDINLILQQLSALETKIRKESPAYANLKYPQALTLEEIQQNILDDDTLLLEYALGEERSFLFVVGKNSFTTHTLPPRADIEAEVDNYLASLKTSETQDLRDGETLSQILLSPAADQLSNQRLVIVGNGKLQLLPFAALPLPPLTPPSQGGGEEISGFPPFSPLEGEMPKAEGSAETKGGQTFSTQSSALPPLTPPTLREAAARLAQGGGQEISSFPLFSPLEREMPKAEGSAETKGGQTFSTQSSALPPLTPPSQGGGEDVSFSSNLEKKQASGFPPYEGGTKGGQTISASSPGSVSTQSSALPPLTPPSRGGGKDGQPLLLNHEIIALPSISSLAVQRTEWAKRPTAPKTLAVLADPVFNERDKRLGGKVESTSQDLSSFENLLRAGCTSLDRLYYTQQEAKTLLAQVPDSQEFSALGFAANRDTATNPDLQQYQMVHLATHGCIQDNPLLSGLAFSRYDEQGNSQDSFLRLQDVFNLQLNADLVVLSACETGTGDDVQGEGVVGLTRGFMYAGARRVVVSLWSVNDTATADLMENYYEKMLQDNLDPIAALRAAQLEMWNSGQWKSPYYWAAFTVQGDW